MNTDKSTKSTSAASPDAEAMARDLMAQILDAQQRAAGGYDGPVPSDLIAAALTAATMREREAIMEWHDRRMDAAADREDHAVAQAHSDSIDMIRARSIYPKGA